jgi:hypothetical protein
MRNRLEILFLLLFVELCVEEVQLIFSVGVDGEETVIGFVPESLDGGSDVLMGALESIFKVFCGWVCRFRRHVECRVKAPIDRSTITTKNELKITRELQ